MSIRSPGMSSWSCLQQLVAVARVVAEDEEDGRLREALEPGANLPAARAEPTPPAGVPRKAHATRHATAPSELQCKTHIARR